VLLEVQMHADRRFHRRLAAETFRLLQQHEEVEHLRVLVLMAHRRLALGNRQPSPLQRFLKHDVTWVDLSALARRRDLDPALALRLLERRCGAIGSESRRRLAGGAGAGHAGAGTARDHKITPAGPASSGCQRIASWSTNCSLNIAWRPRFQWQAPGSEW
jgi:hypothetical protein